MVQLAASRLHLDPLPFHCRSLETTVLGHVFPPKQPDAACYVCAWAHVCWHCCIRMAEKGVVVVKEAKALGELEARCCWAST